MFDDDDFIDEIIRLEFSYFFLVPNEILEKILSFVGPFKGNASSILRVNRKWNAVYKRWLHQKRANLIAMIYEYCRVNEPGDKAINRELRETSRRITGFCKSLYKDPRQELVEIKKELKILGDRALNKHHRIVNRIVKEHSAADMAKCSYRSKVFNNTNADRLLDQSISIGRTLYAIDFYFRGM